MAPSSKCRSTRKKFVSNCFIFYFSENVGKIVSSTASRGQRFTFVRLELCSQEFKNLAIPHTFIDTSGDFLGERLIRDI